MLIKKKYAATLTVVKCLMTLNKCQETPPTPAVNSKHHLLVISALTGSGFYGFT